MSRQSRYPDSFDFHGFNAPIRVEYRVENLAVEGKIPFEIDGCFFRATADPAHPPLISEDTMLSGDGMVSAFRISAGHVDFEIRYVCTPRYLAERAARRALFGAYRNPFTDDPSVAGVDRTVANTTPVWHAGHLLMTKEDGLGYEVDPVSLDTIGRWDYGGKLRSQTFTAHPKIDPVTGELFFFGYEAGGLCTRDVAYCIASNDGNLVSEQWFQAPYCALMHDFAISERYAIFPIFPTKSDYARLARGGAHWVHEPEGEAWVGIMPRYGDVGQMRWFHTRKGSSSFHIMNAFDEEGIVHLDIHVLETNAFPFIRAASGIEKKPSEIRSQLVRWSFDMNHMEDRYHERVLGPPGDMPRVAAKDVGRRYRIGYYAIFDPDIGPPNVHGVIGVGFNALLRLEVDTGSIQALALAADESVSEPVHIPAKDPAHEGWLAFVVDNHSSMSSALWFAEAENPGKGAVAKVVLPLRLRPQVHGTWVSATELEKTIRRIPAI